VDIQYAIILSSAALWGFSLFMLGANNAANAIGALMGAGLTSIRLGQAIFMLGVTLGALLEGYKLSMVLSESIWTSLGFESSSILLVSTAITLFATSIGVPLPVTLAVVGGAWGISFYSGQIPWGQVTVFSIAWVLTPAVAAFVSLVVYAVVRKLRRLIRKVLDAALLEGAISLIGSFYIAYVLGANTVGLISGLTSAHPPLILLLIAGLITGLGGVKSIKVCQTVGGQFVGLGITATAIVQVSSALVIHALTQISCPASITQAVVGAILGVGIFKGVRAINYALVARVFFLWALTPVIAALLTCLVYAQLLSLW